MKSLLRMISDFVEFINEGIWRIRLRNLPKGRRLLTRYLRVLLLLRNNSEGINVRSGLRL